MTTLEDVGEEARKHIEASVTEAHGHIRAAIAAVTPLATSPLVDNGLASAVRGMIVSLDALDDKVPEIHKKIEDRFGSNTKTGGDV